MFIGRSVSQSCNGQTTVDSIEGAYQIKHQGYNFVSNQRKTCCQSTLRFDVCIRESQQWVIHSGNSLLHWWMSWLTLTLGTFAAWSPTTTKQRMTMMISWLSLNSDTQECLISSGSDERYFNLLPCKVTVEAVHVQLSSLVVWLVTLLHDTSTGLLSNLIQSLCMTLVGTSVIPPIQRQTRVFCCRQDAGLLASHSLMFS